jgi:hypothetical protein
MANAFPVSLLLQVFRRREILLLVLVLYASNENSLEITLKY